MKEKFNLFKSNKPFEHDEQVSYTVTVGVSVHRQSYAKVGNLMLDLSPHIQFAVCSMI